MISLIPRGFKFKTIACITLVAFIVLTMTSCVSFKVNQIAIESNDEQPSVTMNLYLKVPDEGQEDAVLGGVGTTLFFQREDNTFVTVASSRQGRWVLRNSPPGRYRIDLDPTAEINGQKETFEGSLTKTFTLKPGERAEIIIVLKKIPVGVIVLISVLIVGLIILMILARKERPPKLSDLLIPPLPPHLPGIPPPSVFVIPLMIFARHGRPFLGPPPIFIDGGFYYHGPLSVDTAPSDEPTPALEEEPPASSASSAPSSPIEKFFFYPRKGQSEEQQAQDRYECHIWAVGQTGWDPTKPTGVLTGDQMNRKSSDYKRAMGACLDAREYTVK